MTFATHNLQYEAASLADLTEHFRKQAEAAWTGAQHAKTAKEKAHYQGQWFAYDQASRMLNNTKIKTA